MSEPPRTSFIPKQDAASASAKPRPRRTFNVFNFLMTVVFLGSIILAVGVYLLETQTEKKLEANKQALAGIKTTFNAGDIVSLRELDKRIDTAEHLLKKHLSPSVIFDTLERRTQGEVQFQSFTYTLNESGTVALSLNGIAPRLNTVALQSQEFATDSVIERALFTNLGISYEGEGPEAEEIVRFTTTARIDTSLMRYEPPVTNTDTEAMVEEVGEGTDTESTDTESEEGTGSETEDAAVTADDTAEVQSEESPEADESSDDNT